MAVLCRASVLGDLAASMKAGEWAELSTGGFTVSLLTMGDESHNIFQYTDDFTWDPVSRQILFVGNPHGPYDAPGKFVVYEEATNSWKAQPKNFSVFWHAYDHNAINVSRREFYHRHNSDVFRYRIDSKSWDALPDLPSNSVCCGALEWFPDLDRLVFVGGSNSSGEIMLFNFSTNQWTRHSFRPVLGVYHHFAEYNPVHKVLVFGGGNSNPAVYKMDAAGTVTRLKDAPTGDLGPANTTTTLDPVSGKYLVLDDNGAFYEFDVVNDAWKSLGTWNNVMTGAREGAGHLPATPISTHGVVMFAYYNYSSSKVWLYKHTEGGTAAEKGTVRVHDAPAVEVFPNPFKSTVTASLPEGAGKAAFSVYNARGRKVAGLTPGPAGRIVWTPNGLPGGVYLLRGAVGQARVSAKLLYLK
jgi:hypothetical protein